MDFKALDERINKDEKPIVKMELKYDESHERKIFAELLYIVKSGSKPLSYHVTNIANINAYLKALSKQEKASIKDLIGRKSDKISVCNELLNGGVMFKESDIDKVISFDLDKGELDISSVRNLDVNDRWVFRRGNNKWDKAKKKRFVRRFAIFSAVALMLVLMGAWIHGCSKDVGKGKKGNNDEPDYKPKQEEDINESGIETSFKTEEDLREAIEAAEEELGGIVEATERDLSDILDTNYKFEYTDDPPKEVTDTDYKFGYVDDSSEYYDYTSLGSDVHTMDMQAQMDYITGVCIRNEKYPLENLVVEKDRAVVAALNEIRTSAIEGKITKAEAMDALICYRAYGMNCLGDIPPFSDLSPYAKFIEISAEEGILQDDYRSDICGYSREELIDLYGININNLGPVLNGETKMLGD